MASERTERATPRRRSEARRRGQVVRSADLIAAVMMLTAALLIPWYGAFAARTLATGLQGFFSSLPRELTPGLLAAMMRESAGLFLRVALPPLGLVAVIGTVVAVVQSGLVFAPAALKPDWRRLDPFAGFQRLFSRRGAFEALKTILKLTIVTAATYPVIRADITVFVALTGADVLGLGQALGQAVRSLLLRIGLVYLVLAAIDYFFQRWDFEQRLRMTREEVREELRQTEGDPQIRARIRKLQRQYAQRRMMANVPKATVVVTNPTHLAIALRYDPRETPAPIVVAKGAGQVAERIKAIARAHAIPVVEHRPVAQALYRLVDVGQVIPVTLYEAVADIIAYVYRLRTGAMVREA